MFGIFRKKSDAHSPQVRVVNLVSEITQDTATNAIAQLLFFEDAHPGLPIALTVNSPGGNVVAALAILDTMQALKAPVHTVNTGVAGGIAALIIAGGEKRHRAAYPHSVFLLSSVQTLDDHPSEIERVQLKLNGLFREFTGQSRVTLDAGIQFSSETAVQLGVIDRIEPTPN